MSAVPPVTPPGLETAPRICDWLSFERQGEVAVRTGKVELGQGILAALARIAGDELGLTEDRIRVLDADTDHAPDEGLTAGSLSVQQSGAAVRLAAATARAALLDAAAERLAVPHVDLSDHEGAILTAGADSGETFWTLAARVDWSAPVRTDATLRPLPQDARQVPRPDLVAKLGGGGYIHDLAPEGLRHVRIVRQPSRLARLVAVDEAALARRHPGVSIYRQGDFLALLAEAEWPVVAAHQDCDRFVTWEDAPDRWTPPQTPPPAVTQTGAENADHSGGDASRRVFSASYGRGPIAHASIGPACALARFADGRLTVWTHSQGIFPLRAVMAKTLGLAAGDIRLIHAHGAGSYGHNGADDAAFDAAVVALAHPGIPVRVLWSREDDLSRAPFGAPMTTDIAASLDAGGRIADWSLTVDSTPHTQRPGTNGAAHLSSAEALDPDTIPRAIADLPEARGGGASRNSIPIYRLPQARTEVRIRSVGALRTSSLRSLGAYLNVFAIESAMDELATLAGADPLDFRIAHLDDPRALAVLRAAAAMADWPGPAGEGQAMGLGLSRYKGRGAWLAAVARVQVDEEVRLDRLWLAVDAGRIVDPEGARAQIEGGAIQSASWTLKEEIAVEDGRVAPFDWTGYPILRFSETPQIETRFLAPPGAPPLGVGEASQGPVAAAIGNAVSRAIGLRLRHLPMTRERLVAAAVRG